MVFVDISIPSQKELGLPRSKEEIRRDLSEAQEDLKQYSEGGNDFWEKMSDNAREVVNQAADEVFENQDLNPEAKRAALGQWLEKYADNEEIKGVLKFCAAGYEINDRVMALQKEYLPYKKEEVAVMAHELSARINFEAVLSYHKDKERQVGSDLLSNTLREMFFLRSIEAEMATGGEDLDYNRLDYYQNSLDSCKDIWQAKGFLNNEPDEDYQGTVNDAEQNRENRTKLLEKINSLESDLVTFQDLAQVYRLDFKFSRHPDKYLSNLAYVLKQGDEETSQSMVGFDVLDYDARFIRAVYGYVSDCEEEFKLEGKLPLDELDTKKYIEHTKKDWNETAKNLNFSGFVDKENMTMVVNQKDVLVFLRNNFPASFLTGVTEVVASDVTPEEDVDLDGDKSAAETKTKTLGRFVPEYDQDGNYESGKIIVYEPVHVNSSADSVEMLLVKSKFEDTLAHEVGHGVQCNLNRDEMEGWNKVMEDDPMAVSWYVNYAREKGIDKGKREDFSESIMLFIKNPAVLQLISEKRFEYMTELYRRHMSEAEFSKFESSMRWSIELQKMVWEQHHMSKQQIKDLYY